MPVAYARDGDIGFIRIASPPVNALNQAVRAGLVEALGTALADPEARAIVLYGEGRMYSAGADIAEFGSPLAAADPDLPTVITGFDDSAKPVVAVLHGSALGGALELALGCHFRIALPSTRLGLPEVKLGILPGAGGTQRLPRLVGVRAALDMITSGRTVMADEAEEMGLVDAVIRADTPVAAGEHFARRVLDKKLPVVRARDRTDRLPVGAPEKGVFDEYRSRLKKRARGQLSPLVCVDAVEAAATLPFVEGLEREAELSARLHASDQHMALVHAFFAEREASKVPGLDRGARPRPVKRAAIIGAGTMGGGITMCFVDHGLPVTIVDTSQDALDRGLGRIRANYEKSVARGRLTSEAAEDRMSLITPSLDFADIGDADAIIEAVFEEMDVKKEVFRKIDANARSGALLATNTSYLDVNAIAAETGRPEDVLGMHFFSPANVMRLLEVVRADRASDSTLRTALAIGALMRKVSVVAGVCDGFIGNRMYRVYQRQAFYMLEDGALPHEIDAAMTEFGFAMGPLAVGDLTGHDADYFTRRREDATRDPDERYVELPDKLIELGRIGQKTGAGWYRYGEDGRTPVRDPEFEALIVEESRRKGIERRTIPAEEIRMRALAALVNEGARILEEGIALRASDIDTVWINGYGFPAHRGGPMYWADACGIGKLLSEIEAFAGDDPGSWRLSSLLADLAGSGGTFAGWDRANVEKSA